MYCFFYAIAHLHGLGKVQVGNGIEETIHRRQAGHRAGDMTAGMRRAQDAGAAADRAGQQEQQAEGVAKKDHHVIAGVGGYHLDGGPHGGHHQ